MSGNMRIVGGEFVPTMLTQIFCGYLYYDYNILPFKFLFNVLR